MRIIEERDYRTKPGRAPEFVRIYEEHGLPVQKEMLGDFLGYFVSDVGELNRVVALWGFDSMDDRLARRDAMMADHRWAAYLDKVLPLLDQQTTRFLRPTRFSPLQ
ncbi:NIPSNAP family protein [Rhodovulum sp. 12E13]|uniref:NIPSNAP family protein n=1 Tax=Rhodovulum sp. 12E13 TaxID=2203891 RepID=UPI000E128AA4|nr:NIPSNAP family protein [Rhodovulum sp. 12E13]RDC69041.1 NIPSNAP family protein [Rhodovulum sp. 12E13]